MKYCSRFIFLFLVVAVTPLRAATPPASEDLPASDLTQILKALKGMREQQLVQQKALKAKALQQAQAAASNPSAAQELWEDAVRGTQFNGATKEAAQFRAWKDQEGDALKEPECVVALRLYFNWLAITLQKSSGVSVRDLMPAIINHTKEASADKTAMTAFEEASKKGREMDASGKHGMNRKRTDAQVKAMHDRILQGLGGSVVVTWLKIGDLLNDAAKPKVGEQGGWEMSPGNVDGIFERIILPELRAEKDPRILEYWDMKLRSEAEAATKAKLAFEVEKFNTIRRPQLLWSRAQDVNAIGQKNRAITEMFTVIKTYPMHPEVASWIATLETILATPKTPAAPAVVRGTGGTDASGLPIAEPVPYDEMDDATETPTTSLPAIPGGGQSR